jgi:hypothetical protein
MKTSNRSTTRLRKTALSVGILIALACAGGPFDENEFLSYFMPESATATERDKFYYFSPRLYNYDADMQGEGDETPFVADNNTKAWAAYLNGWVAEKTIQAALADHQSAEAKTLTNALKTKNEAARQYLQFAWDNENLGSVWQADETSEPNTDSAATAQAVRNSLEMAIAESRANTDLFLKERYGFQAVKLACVDNNYPKAAKLYDQLIAPLPKKTLISYWALSRKAGAMLALGDTARAIFDFAQVFANCPSRRREAEMSLRINHVRYNETALKFAENNQQRAAVLAICAIQPYQDALPKLKQLVEIDPTNPLIELVMAREINRNEYFWLADRNPVEPTWYENDSKGKADSVRFETRKTESESYASQLRDFALTSASNKALPNSAFWYTAAAYLDYLKKDYATAASELTQAEQTVPQNADLRKQIALQKMLLLAVQTEKITPEVETKLIGYLEQFGNATNFRMGDAFVRTCQQFADLYRGSNAPGAKSGGWLQGCSRPKTELVADGASAKAYLLTLLTSGQLNKNGAYFMASTDQLRIEDTTSANVARQVVDFVNKPDATDFDKRLLKLTGLTTDYFYTLLGRRYMAEQRYAEAAETWAKLQNPAKAWGYQTQYNDNGTETEKSVLSLYFSKDPFELPLKQKQHRPNTYTPVTFARRMAELQEKTTKLTGDEAAQVYYELGCGAYNLSYYGNAWVLVKRSWSSGEPVYSSFINLPESRQTELTAQAQQDPYYTTAAAKAFFGLSLKAAKSPLLADRAAYLAARCEENQFLARRAAEVAKRGGYVADDDADFNKAMDDLRRKEYATTFADFFKNHTRSTYHSQMLRECATYSDFLIFGDDGKTEVEP